jgi:methionyl-tRNA formyltransferase
MQMDAGLDTGPVLLEQRLAIGADETAGQLHDRLSVLGAQTLADGLGLLRAGMRPLRAAARRRRDVRAQAREGRSAARLVAARDRPRPQGTRVRSVADRRGRHRGRTRAHPWRDRDRSRHRRRTGRIVRTGREGIDIACGTGALRVRVLQRAGGKAITAADYLNARRDLQPA